MNQHSSSNSLRGVRAMMLLFVATLVFVTMAAGPAQKAQAQASSGNPANNPTPTYTPLEPLPCIPASGVDCSTYDPNNINFQSYLQNTFNLVIALAAAAAVFMIVFGGLQYMTTDSWQNKSAGLDKAKNALLGLVLVLCSYIILRTIDPRLVAIPSTLVTPLNIDYGGLKSNSDFLNDLTNQASLDEQQARTDANTARNAAAAANTQIADTKSSICSKIATVTGSPGPDGQPTCSDIDVLNFCDHNQQDTDCASLSTESNASIASQSTNITAAARSVMANEAHSCAKTANLSWINNLGGGYTSATNDCITQIVNDQSNALVAINAMYPPPNAIQLNDVKQAVSDQANYYTALIKIAALRNDSAQTFLGSTDISNPDDNTMNVISDINENADQITDPALKAQLHSNMVAACPKCFQ